MIHHTNESYEMPNIFTSMMVQTAAEILSSDQGEGAGGSRYEENN